MDSDFASVFCSWRRTRSGFTINKPESPLGYLLNPTRNSHRNSLTRVVRLGRGRTGNAGTAAVAKSTSYALGRRRIVRRIDNGGSRDHSYMTDTESSSLYDPGLQPERTGLAWNRTVLVLAVALAIVGRLLFMELPIVAATAAFTLLTICGAMGALPSATRRYSQINNSLVRAGDLSLARSARRHLLLVGAVGILPLTAAGLICIQTATQ